ncbi:DUF1330 domain-containing protein [Kallotenue papyrolyticum]|uniref:DUF1330 domain-containing protein n=1 Tax=Kallotenue papyrolyticum TaxID=1325125 RepID=UPI000478577F|nr:DUF1330 domain-containing protein [Kallotenue papyrolyticum]
MPAYVIVEVTINDQEAYAAYRQLSGPSVEQYGGRFLARGGAIAPLEGGWQPERIVIIEFPDLATAQRWYASPEYRTARQRRAGAAQVRMLAVEGLPPIG